MKALGRDPLSCSYGAEILKAIAHPLRLQIIAILQEGEENVGDLARKLGTPPAIVSQQLRILRSHQLVAVTRAAGNATYRLAEPNLRKLIHCMEGCLAGRRR